MDGGRGGEGCPTPQGGAGPGGRPRTPHTPSSALTIFPFFLFSLNLSFEPVTPPSLYLLLWSGGTRAIPAHTLHPPPPAAGSVWACVGTLPPTTKTNTKIK